MRYTVYILSIFILSGCGWQGIPQAKNATEASLAEITNQYKRRSDLIPNLVKVVKKYATHEKETLIAVVEARAGATKTTIDASNLSNDKIQSFQEAQGSLSQALSKLLMVSERYPDLKSDQHFLDLQAQLEGSENRIAVARGRHISQIKKFNDMITVPPMSWTNKTFYNYKKMDQWSVGEEEKALIEEPPQIDL